MPLPDSALLRLARSKKKKPAAKRRRAKKPRGPVCAVPMTRHGRLVRCGKPAKDLRKESGESFALCARHLNLFDVSTGNAQRNRVVRAPLSRAPVRRPAAAKRVLGKKKGLGALPDGFLRRIAAAGGPKASAARAELRRRRA